MHGWVRITSKAAWLLLAITFLLRFELGAQDLGQIGNKKPFALSGSLSLQGGPYFYSGDGAARNLPYYWNSTGTVTLSLWGWQAPFSYSVGSQERTWTQPFNRYGVSPYYKWIKLHLGYRSMRFNPYTFAGLQFYGGGIELEPKGFRFAAFYGRFNKPIAQDTLGSIVPVPAYRRMGMGVKIGAGSRRTFVDLLIFRAADDTTSIPELVGNTRVTPMENVALGLSGRVAIGPKLSWEFDLGGSALTEDVRAPILEDSSLPRFTNTLFTPRFSTRALFAGNTSLRWHARYFSMRVQYREVEPGYRSLGAFYQQTDVRSVTVEPSVRIKKGKLRLGGSYGLQQDNIRGTKITTSVRRIGSANATWNPSRIYGVDANFSNYGVAQEAGLRVLNDTFRVAQVNRVVSLSQRFTLVNKVRSWNVMLTSGFQQLQDLNPFGTFSTAENEVMYANLHIGRIRMRDNLMVSGGLNANRNRTSTGEFVLVGPSLGFSRPFAKQKLMLSLSASFNKALQEGRDAGTTVNANHTLQYRVGKAHRLQLSINALQNKTSFVATREFTEVRIMGGYVLTFQTKS
jgi:hypothetical protein